MATSSTIAMWHKDGSVTQIRCHWDGHLDHNGVILQENYSRVCDVEKLVKMGNVSRLCERLEPTGKHDFDHPEDGVTIFYSRDRGDALHSYRFVSMQDFLDRSYEEQYNYFYSEFSESWYFARKNKPWIPMHAALDEAKENRTSV